MSLIEEGRIEPSTTARSVLGGDLPKIGDEVTIEHLLGHRSGIGDYVDEGADQPITDYVLPIPGPLSRNHRAVPLGARRARSDVPPG